MSDTEANFDAAHRRRIRRRCLLLACAAALLAICVRLAWVGDDAYITLRTIENWVTGNGLRWNVADRAQTYTHPLWLLLVALGRWLSGETYCTTIVLSLAVALLAVVSLLRRCPSSTVLLAVALLLATARAFPEYATSGLETPLTYALLVGFVAAATSQAAPPRRCARCVLWAALLATNRMDLALLCAPGVIAALRGVRLRALLWPGLLAASPFLLWLLFAAVYYGTPLPVTAHAKVLGHGLAAGALAGQGLHYVWRAATEDPVLVATILAGIAVGLRESRQRPLALGMALHVAYVIGVGGDFMAGRFLLPPFVVAVAMLARAPAPRPLAVWCCIAAAPILTFAAGGPAWLRTPTTEAATPPPAPTRGVGDERAFYYRRLGLLSPTRDVPAFGSLDQMLWPEGRREPWVLLGLAAGALGFRAGARCHVLDPLLCDPLLARLPAGNPETWHVGHVLRRVPEGYYETLATGENRLRHAGLRRYYDALRTIMRAPVFAPERLRTLWQMWCGAFDADLAAFVADDYYRPPRVRVAATALPPPLQLGTYWFDEPRLQLLYDGGVAIEFATPPAGPLRVQVLGLCQFRFRFVRGGVEVGAAEGEPLPLPPAPSPSSLAGDLHRAFGLREVLVTVPPLADGFDTLWVDAFGPSDRAAGPPALGSVSANS